jgi:hypothetical protein
MCYTAKASISAWWILALMTLFLWYRDQEYDRILAPFLIALGLIQLIEYGIHSGASPQQAGRALFLTLWAQCLILAIGVALFLRRQIDPTVASRGQNLLRYLSLANLILFVTVFAGALAWCWWSQPSFSGAPGEAGHIEWQVNDSPFLGRYGWLYLIGIFLPLLLLLWYYGWNYTPLLVLILYGVGSALYVTTRFPSIAFSSMWCYLSVGFAFLAWFLGIMQRC